MLRNYLKLACRNLWRRKGYACINVMGLGVGIACCLLSLLYVHDELKYDRFHDNLEQRYRIHEVMDETGEEWASASWAVAEVLEADYGDRVKVARLRRNGPGVVGEVTVRHRDRIFIETNFFFADATLFDVLSLPLAVGDPGRVLARPGDLVLTREMAAKYFGTENPVGQTLVVAGQRYTVTGVLENLPAHSHLQLGFLAAMPSTWNPSPGDGAVWRFNIYYTYVQVPDPALIPAMAATLRARQQEQTDHASAFTFFPLQDIHLRSQAERELAAGGDIRTVYFFALVGVLLLAIACINFINLATAQAAERAREVGVRKVLGANRPQLMRQFIGESVLLTLLATLGALVLALAVLPLFNGLTGKSLVLSLLAPWWMPAFLPGVVVLVGLCAGAYPAFYLSALQPVRVLKGRLLGRRRAPFRKGLVTAQFGCSTLFIIGTLVIAGQLDFLQRANLGFDREQVLVLSVADTQKLRRHYTVLRDQVRQLPGVVSMATSNVVPGERLPVSYFAPEGAAPGDSLVSMRKLGVDEGFVATYGLDLVSGRNFEQTLGRDTDRAYYLVNEAAVEALGWDEPLGKRINRGEVVGVVSNFHYASLHHEVEPLIITNQGGGGAVSIRVATDDLPALLAAIEQAWTSVIPYEPFAFYFVDTVFDALYHREALLRQTARYAAVLAILIACLGLFGLSAYTTAQRTREIGLRKVLGASLPSILLLLYQDFFRPVGLAFLIAVPVAYIVLRHWLQGFVYRIEIGPGVFLLAGGLIAATALLTVSYQALRSALTNPVDCLRHE